MLVHQLLDVAADRTPDALALIERDRQVTYRTLAEMTNRCARLLRRCGVTAGERVVVALDNSAEMVAAYLGAMQAGGVAVPSMDSYPMMVRTLFKKYEDDGKAASASASPSRTRRIATLMLASRLLRLAAAGCSSMAIDSDA